MQHLPFSETYAPDLLGLSLFKIRMRVPTKTHLKDPLGTRHISDIRHLKCSIARSLPQDMDTKRVRQVKKLKTGVFLHAPNSIWMRNHIAGNSPHVGCREPFSQKLTCRSWYESCGEEDI